MSAPGVPPRLTVPDMAQNERAPATSILHITTGPDTPHNVLALAFSMLIVFLVLAG